MKTVYKFELQLNNRNNLSLPRSAKFIKFDVQQSNRLMCWYELETNASRWPRNLRIFATGEEVPTDSTHLGSCLAGQFVWHLYEVE